MRRSLFTNEAERTKFLHHLVTGTRDILRARQGLTEHENYHEFCRLLGRLKTNYQLSELVSRRPGNTFAQEGMQDHSFTMQPRPQSLFWVLSTRSFCEKIQQRGAEAANSLAFLERQIASWPTDEAVHGR